MRLRPKKSLGQNFLISHQVVADIVDASQIKAGESVIEVGPGEGMLTEALTAAGAKVTAIEKDDRLIEILRKKFPSVNIIHQDALLFTPPTGNYKVVANIPYYITGELIQKFLSTKNKPNTMVLMLQKEVAERIVAKNCKESILSLSVKAYGKPEYVRTVDKVCFRPIPSIDSAVLAIRDISGDFFTNISEEKFFKLVKQGFGHKRKKLSNNLNLSTELRERYDNLRAETLSLADWRNLYLQTR